MPGALQVGNAAFTITADGKQFRKGLRQSRADARKFTTETSADMEAFSAATVKSMAAASAGVVAFATTSFQQFAEFDRGISHLENLNARWTDDHTAQLKRVAREGLIPLGDATAATYQIMSAGITRPVAALDQLLVTSKLAAVGLTTTETAARALGGALNAYGESQAAAVEYANALLTTQNLGITTVDELGRSMGDLNALAGSLNLTYADMLGLLASLTSTGAPTTKSVTTLEAALRQLSNPADKLAKTFAEISGQSFRDFTRSGGTLTQALNLLGENAETTDRSVFELGVTAEAAAAITVAATTEMREKNVANLRAIRDQGTDYLGEGFRNLAGDAQGAWDSTQNFVTEVGTSFGELVDNVIFRTDVAAPFDLMGGKAEELPDIIGDAVDDILVSLGLMESGTSDRLEASATAVTTWSEEWARSMGRVITSTQAAASVPIPTVSTGPPIRFTGADVSADRRLANRVNRASDWRAGLREAERKLAETLGFGGGGGGGGGFEPPAPPVEILGVGGGLASSIFTAGLPGAVASPDVTGPTGADIAEAETSMTIAQMTVQNATFNRVTITDSAFGLASTAA